MVFNNKFFDINLKMNGQDMDKTENERDLGIMTSSNLKWSMQVMVAAKRANMVLGQLSIASKVQEALCGICETSSRVRGDSLVPVHEEGHFSAREGTKKINKIG